MPWTYSHSFLLFNIKLRSLLQYLVKTLFEVRKWLTMHSTCTVHSTEVDCCSPLQVTRCFGKLYFRNLSNALFASFMANLFPVGEGKAECTVWHWTQKRKSLLAFAHSVTCSCNYIVTFSVWYNVNKQQRAHPASWEVMSLQASRDLCFFGDNGACSNIRSFVFMVLYLSICQLGTKEG